MRIGNRRQRKHDDDIRFGLVNIIIRQKIPQKLLCKNTSVDKETQKLEKRSVWRDSLPCAFKLKPIFSPAFALFVVQKEETFPFLISQCYL